jgi:hypothetical protein
METATISLFCHWSIFSSEKIRQKCPGLPNWKDSMDTAPTTLLCDWSIFSSEGLHGDGLSLIDFLRQNPEKKNCASHTNLEGLHGDSLHLSVSPGEV